MNDATAWHGHRPGSVLGAAALGAALVTMGLLATLSSVSLLSTAVGVVGLTVGLAAGDRRFVGVGVLGVLGGVLAAGAADPAAERFLPAAAGGLLSWVFAVRSLDRRAELRGGTVERSEFLHVAATTAVAALAAVGAYLLSRAVDVGVSVLGVLLLLVAAVVLALAVRE